MNDEGRMVLFINGEEARLNMEVTTFRGETYILTGWRAPGEICGGQNGKVYCKSKEDFEKNTVWCNEWYPSVIGGEFKYVEDKELSVNKCEQQESSLENENVVTQRIKRGGR